MRVLQTFVSNSISSKKNLFDECTKHKQIEKDEVITNSLELRNEIIFTCNQRVVCSKPIEYSS